MILWSTTAILAYVVEVTIPLEDVLERVYQRKNPNYIELVTEAAKNGWKTKMFPVEVGCKCVVAIEEEGSEEPLRTASSYSKSVKCSWKKAAIGCRTKDEDGGGSWGGCTLDASDHHWTLWRHCASINETWKKMGDHPMIPMTSPIQLPTSSPFITGTETSSPVGLITINDKILTIFEKCLLNELTVLILGFQAFCHW